MVFARGFASAADRREMEMDLTVAMAAGPEHVARFAAARGIKVRPTLLMEALPDVNLDFGLTRASQATRINAFGALETIPANVARHGYSAAGEYQGIIHEEAATQFLLNNAAPVTQTVALAAGSYCLWLEGSGSAAISGAATGNATAAAPAVFTLASAGSVTVTFSGTVTRAQLENGGAFATSFIQTVGAAATRATDDWSMPLGPWFNPNEGVVLFEGSFLPGVKGTGGVSRCLFSIETTSTNRLLVFMANDGSLAPRIASTAGGAANPGSVSFTGDKFKAALRYGIGSGVGVLAVNGTLGSASSPASLPAGLSTVKGRSTSLANAFNGRIERVAFLPRVITNAEMATLTAL